MVKSPRATTTRSATKPSKAGNISKYPCGSTTCGQGAVKEGIQCDACRLWYHNKCSRLGIRALTLYTEHSFLKWICPTCIQKINTTPKPRATEEQGVQAGEPGTQTDSGTAQDKNDSLPRLNPSDREVMVRQRVGSENKPTPCPEINDGWKTVDRGKRTKIEKDANKRGPKTRPRVSSNLIRKSCRPCDKTSSLEEIRDMLLDQQKTLSVLQKEGIALSRELHTLKAQSNIALGRNRNVIIRGIPEPYMRESRQRDRAMRYHVNNLLRTANITLPVKIKRVLRLGRWVKDQAPRPVVAEFVNPRTRDKFLAAAGLIEKETGGRVKVEPDDSANWKRNPGNGNVDAVNNQSVGIDKSPVLMIERLSIGPVKEPHTSISNPVRPGSIGKDQEPKKKDTVVNQTVPKNGGGPRT